MAEKILENQVCQTCGANVRLNAQFCFNCGSAVKAEPSGKNGKGTSDSWLRENLVEEDNSSKVTTALNDIPVPILKPDIPLEEPQKEILVKEPQKEILAKTPVKTPVKTKTAETRQKSKPERKKTVEISWEEPYSAPNVWFLLVTFILTLFAVGVLVAMLYIR